MSALSVLCAGSLWRDPVARTAKATGKTFVTGFIKSGTATEPVWANVVAFDEAAKAELLRLKAGESLSVQGPARLGRPSLDVTANHVAGFASRRAQNQSQPHCDNLPWRQQAQPRRLCRVAAIIPTIFHFEGRTHDARRMVQNAR